MPIRDYTEVDRDPVVQLSLRAWAPVFASLEEALSPAIFRVIYQPDWLSCQRKAVEAVLDEGKMRVWVADLGAGAVGFVAAHVHEDKTGEVYMLAVDPDQQRRGIGVALTQVAEAWLKEAGANVIMIGTGGDPGHGPARRTYEKCGYRALPVVQYYKVVVGG